MKRLYPDKLIIGITGSIATGKSLITKALCARGEYVIDADIISREVLALAREDVRKTLGLTRDPSRKELAQIIYSAVEKRQALDDLLHPLIRKRIAQEIKEAPAGLVFADIPLLYETGCRALVDRVLVVYADRETEIKRLMERDGINHEYALKKIASQEEIEIKKDKADDVIDNRGEEEATLAALDALLARWKEEL